MIDLHCHLLPGIDDGANNLEQSLQMAHIAQQDGITTIACTPHIYPGVYENEAIGIKAGVLDLQKSLQDAGLILHLAYGADTHLVPDMLDGLQNGRIPSLNNTRYFLLEPAHHTRPPKFTQLISNIINCGYMPIITHPERLTWADEYYNDFTQAVKLGAWLQITAGSLLGKFGRLPQYLAENMLDDGIVHIIATDAHDALHRVPQLTAGKEAAAKWVGQEEANRMVYDRPKSVLADTDPKTVVPVLIERHPPSILAKLAKKLGVRGLFKYRA